ncbi:hypothetical protein ACRALDRAFT_205811 [Sodiomyces alcalophilus JCM 7366]|uniref:uncharacterized protein n=1 Tax=Sodiomyces alcalophilus JCM 7366 TaxID=591952 RepID=UPI0039B55EA3
MPSVAACFQARCAMRKRGSRQAGQARSPLSCCLASFSPNAKRAEVPRPALMLMGRLDDHILSEMKTDESEDTRKETVLYDWSDSTVDIHMSHKRVRVRCIVNNVGRQMLQLQSRQYPSPHHHGLLTYQVLPELPAICHFGSHFESPAASTCRYKLGQKEGGRVTPPGHAYHRLTQGQYLSTEGDDPLKANLNSTDRPYSTSFTRTPETVQPRLPVSSTPISFLSPIVTPGSETIFYTNRRQPLSHDSTMGSKSADPVASSSLVLTHPTPTERVACWKATHPQWGTALDLDDYLHREAYLQTVPMARNGGITSWIVTDPSSPPDARPILSACESIRKRCLVASPDGSVQEALAHGVASVFTSPEHRGHGYASRMLALLGAQLASWQGSPYSPSSSPVVPGDGMPAGKATEGAEQGQAARDATASTTTTTTTPQPEVAFSVLYSDIGKSFYAKNGWLPYKSTHIALTPSSPDASSSTSTSGSTPPATPISYHHLAELTSIDESLLRKRLARPLPPGTEPKTRVALLPDLDALLWHMMREDYMTTHIFGSAPTVRGAMHGQPGRRVWAIWMRGYYGGLRKPVGNTLHILRLVLEDEDGERDVGDGTTGGESELVEGLRAVLSIAREEAARWKVNDVQFWNPSPRLRRLTERTGLPHQFVERESDSIASLRSMPGASVDGPFVSSFPVIDVYDYEDARNGSRFINTSGYGHWIAKIERFRMKIQTLIKRGLSVNVSFSWGS